MRRQLLALLLCISLSGLGFQVNTIEAQEHSTISQSTQLKLILKTLLSTRTSRVGDSFTAELAEPIVVGNKVVLPGSLPPQGGASSVALVTGVVTSLEQSKRFSQFGRKASMVLRFDKIKYGSWEQSLAATVVSVHDPVNQGKSVTTTDEGAVQAKENVKGDLIKTGVGAAGGSLLGLIFGSVSKGLAIGLIGGAATILATKGKNVELQPGTGLIIRLDHPLEIAAEAKPSVEKLQP